VGKFNSYFLAENTGMATSTLSIELANLAFIRRTPFIRNFAFFGVADALFAEDTKKDDPYSPSSDPHMCYNMYNAAGGLQFIWRLSRLASIDFYAATDTPKCSGSSLRNLTALLTLKDRGDGSFSKAARSMLGGGHLNIYLGPVVLSGGISYYNFYFDETMKVVAYQAGAGLRF
jgi:hypothetical protein